ncbi:MAG: hypothetical protein AAF138_02565 [Planctomycetota bacterium]
MAPGQPAPEFDDEDRAGARAWLEAVRAPVVRDLLESVFTDVTAAITERRPVCEVSGRCCRFEEYGHRLYVSGLEAAYTLARLRDDTPRRIAEADVHLARQEGGCPFQIEGLCSVHEIKPVACRTYFCDPTAQDWHHDLTERCHERVRTIHELHALPYRYAEWRWLLSLVVSVEADGA